MRWKASMPEAHLAYSLVQQKRVGLVPTRFYYQYSRNLTACDQREPVVRCGA